jgi:hypothetical protein
MGLRGLGFRDEYLPHLSHRLVDGLVSWGDEAAIATRVEAHRNAGADQVMLGFLSDGDQPGPIDMARRLADRFVPR